MKRSSKYFVIFTFISVVLIIGLRIFWYDYHSNSVEQVEVKNGVADLTQLHLTGKYLNLTGEWSFYPNKLMNPNQNHTTEETITVPSNWNGLIDSTNSINQGTYQLQIELPESFNQHLSLRFYSIFSAAEVFVNGELIYTRNELHHGLNDRGFIRGPFHVHIPAEEDSIELLIHVTNQQFPIRGGIANNVYLGSQEVIEEQTTFAYAMQLIVSITFLLHAIYSLVIYFILKDIRKKNFLLFAMMLLLFGASIILDDEVIVQLPISIADANRLLLLLLIATLFVMVKLCSSIFQVSFKKWNNPNLLFYPLIIASIFIPIDYIHYWTMLQFLIFLLTIISMLFLSIKAIFKGNHNGYFIFLFICSYLSNFTWGALIKSNVIQMPFYPIDYLLSMIFIMILFFKQHADTVEENKKQTAIILENEKKKDQFLASTAHELRNPLHAVIVVLEKILADEKKPLSTKTRSELTLALDVSHHMKYTLNDLQDMSRLKDHNISLDIKPTYLYSLSNNIVEVLQLYAQGKAIKILNQIPKDFPAVNADPQRLFQVLFNLVENALKYTREGNIFIKAVQRDNKAIITIEDTGIGIPEKDLERISHPYTRGSNISDYDDHGGVGLGLSISQEFIALHEGNFSIQSQVNKGTRITFTLTISENQNQHIDSSSYSLPKHSIETIPFIHSDSSKEKIIVVDDNPINLQTIRIALSEQYDVTTFDNPENVLKMKNLYDYSLIITDIMMPQMSGYTLTKKIREHFTVTDLPILLLTALNHPSDIATGFQSGANDYLCKPVERHELIARVSTLIQLQHAIKDKVAKESAWLQAQIKPHFLYNTLNSIASLGHSNPDAMVELLFEFGNYLNRSFDTNNTKQLVPLKHEIELVNSYLSIQAIRFPSQFEVNWHIKTSRTAFIPPLVLQTLVENALHHGVLKNRQQEGMIDITLEEVAEQLRLSIQDNGVGIDLLKVYKILASENPKEVGIYNAHKRLKRFNKAGLKISTVKPNGTLISFVLPTSSEDTDY
ncbi:hypothetical protein BTS2_0368 [Bacillus sp. TS-2]|nr:hypothetical protein BTS2_0368 [Bacillus sp. TS-2]